MKKIIWMLSILVISGKIFGQNTDSTNYTPLHWAASQGYVEMLKVLINKGYDINKQDESGFTPLHYAAVSGQLPAVEFLVDSGADLYIVNNQNYTPMTMAARAGEQPVVDYLFIKMRSVRVDQLKAQVEKEQVESDLVKAAKARVEAEQLRQKADEWTAEAKRWRDEAEKWNKEAQKWKAQQVMLDKIAAERLAEAIKAKQASEDKFQSEKAARLAAERIVTELVANERAQAQAVQAAQAALNAQRATDAAIANLADELLKQSEQYQLDSNTNMEDINKSFNSELTDTYDNYSYDSAADLNSLDYTLPPDAADLPEVDDPAVSISSDDYSTSSVSDIEK